MEFSKTRNKPQPLIRVRPRTRVSFDYLAQQKGWKLAEVAERAIKSLARDERVELPEMVEGREASSAGPV